MKKDLEEMIERRKVGWVSKIENLLFFLMYKICFEIKIYLLKIIVIVVESFFFFKKIMFLIRECFI